MISSFTGDTPQDESTVKALFIYNFTKHIEWPAQKMTGSKFIIVVYGNSSITTKLLSILKDRKVYEKTIEIRESENPEDLAAGHIIFIPKATNEKLINVLEKCSGKSALVITEEKRMPAKGSSINIFEKENHLRFELNDPCIRKEGFKVSNQLYQLATSAK